MRDFDEMLDTSLGETDNIEAPGDSAVVYEIENSVENEDSNESDNIADIEENENSEDSTKEIEPTEPKKKPWYKKPKYIIPAIFIIIVLIFNYFCTIVVVNGDSMNPNFTDGNVMIAHRHFDIWRFDVVTIASDKVDNVLIKRVIGLPNETIEFKDNMLFINGEYRPDSYAFGNTEDFTITLGSNEYLCLGDNRENSMDSRYFGPFTEDDIFAKINYKIYPKKK